ncbi:FAD:protein FMN transferase [Novosphingobium sp.]|uniref:FAD:protein FMN transferase n=1 Tax=Novosphingobium sp. TaxID=1874826 RepID=UPI0025D10E96|nr:FAD:protein FMN transferase [Novosphingobium sp.]
MRLAVPLDIDPGVLADWRQDAPVIDLGGETMGTTWRLRLAAPENFDRTAIVEAIEARLEDILAQMSHWRADSVLGRFNRAAAGTWISLPPAFAGVMTAGFAIAEVTDAAFDPAIGAIVDLWGYGPVPVAAPPSADALAGARAVSGWRKLTFDADSHRLLQPGGLRLDLSGIAKGHAVDALAALLRERGCNHFLVEIGGELVGSGMKPDGDPWWVDLETPTCDIPPFRIALHQLAVATSGDYVRGRHTIDPRSALPVEHAMAVSVVHRSAMLADAWATALCVEPPEAMRERATRENLAVRALCRAGDHSEGRIEEWISPALAALLVAP